MAQKTRFVIVTGIKDIDRKFKLLPGIIQKKVLRRSMRAGIKVVAEEMRAQSPVDTGLMQSQVKVRAVKKKSRNEIEIEAKISKHPGLYKTSGATGKTAFYPAIVEYGSSKQPPNPFGRRAFQSKGPAARLLTIKLILEGIEQEILKL